MLADSFRRPADCFLARIMKIEGKGMLSQPWFVGALILALLHQISQKIFDISISLVDSYLDPLLFLPILLQLILFERRFAFGRGSQYVLPWYVILTVILFISIICEFLFPRWNTSFTSDYKDIICYLVGGTVFYVFFNTPLSNCKRKLSHRIKKKTLI